MFTSFLAFLASFTVNHGLISVDRDLYINYHGSIQHDGYTKFSSDPETPLSLQWSVERNFSNGYYCSVLFDNPTAVIANGFLYCVAYSIVADPPAVMAIDLATSQVKWMNNQLALLQNSYFEGLGYSKNARYISVFDQYSGTVSALDATTGKLVQTITVLDSCRGLEECAFAYALGVDNGFLLSWFDLQSGGSYFTSINYDMGTNVTIPSPPTAFGYQMSICSTGSENIFMVQDNFENITAFNIDDNLNIGDELWSDKIIYYEGVSFILPPICIPTLDTNNNINGFQVLYTRKLNAAETDVYWLLADGITGELVDRFYWTFDENAVRSPIIDVDNNIIIRCNENNTLAYMLNSNNDGQWDSLWSITGTDFQDILIINDYLYAVDYDSLNVYNVKDGTLVDSYTFDRELRYANILSGINTNGRVGAVVVGYDRFQTQGSVFVF